jgi:hypothetical protein
VARYHTRARQPSHSATAAEIRLRHRHGLPARCRDTSRNESDERALGHRPNKSRPGTEPRGRTRVAHIPYCEADRNFSASSTNANIGATRHTDKRGGGAVADTDHATRTALAGPRPGYSSDAVHIWAAQRVRALQT